MNIKKNIGTACLAFGLAVLTTHAGEYDLYNQIVSDTSTGNYSKVDSILSTPQLKTQFLEEFCAFHKAKFEETGKYNGSSCGSIEFKINTICKMIFELANLTSNPNDAKLAWDEKLASAGFCILSGDMVYYPFFPRCSENFLTQTKEGKKILAERPALIYARRTHGENSNLTVAESINVFVEKANTTLMPASTKDLQFNAIMKEAVKVIKRKIRQNGQSFVVGDDGINRVQIEIDALTSALQAPKCAGTKEWVASYCPEYTWIDVAWPTDEEIAKLKNDVMYGEIELTEAISQKLLFNLGLDEYNKFIKEYNGD